MEAMLKPHKCPRCGRPAPLEEGLYICINCGHKETNKRQRHFFLEAHKQEILRDVLTIGSVKTRKKWGLPLTTFNALKHRWELRKVWWAPGMQSFSRDGLPKLPAWRQDWPPEFKMRWIETYLAIVGGDEGK